MNALLLGQAQNPASAIIWIASICSVLAILLIVSLCKAAARADRMSEEQEARFERRMPNGNRSRTMIS